MNQFSKERLTSYWVDVMRDGNRESHYRADHVEATLVSDLPSTMPGLDEFRARVDEQIPGAHKWFDSQSRHMADSAFKSRPAARDCQNDAGFALFGSTASAHGCDLEYPE